MKKKIVVLSFVLMIVNSLSLYSQRPTHSTWELLRNKTWEMTISPQKYGIRILESYGEGTIRCSYFSDNGNFVMDTPYYFSDEMEWDFNYGKVGSRSDGKYLIKRGKEEAVVYEVLKLTSDSLIVISKVKPGEILLGVPIPTVYTVQKKKRR